jgi:hypothetical protein
MIQHIIIGIERFKRLMTVAMVSPEEIVIPPPTVMPSDWTAVARADVPLVIEPRDASPFERAAEKLLDAAPLMLRVEGKAGTIGDALADLPAVLRDDAAMLAERFATLMGVDNIRVRVEVISGDACRKFHADYTDLRLITSWAGPGTDWLPPGANESEFERIPTGWVGLFKGHLFAEGHLPCIHRSPPIAGTGESRLLLVIDTPARPVAEQA